MEGIQLWYSASCILCVEPSKLLSATSESRNVATVQKTATALIRLTSVLGITSAASAPSSGRKMMNVSSGVTPSGCGSR